MSDPVAERVTHTPAPWSTGGIFDPNGPDPRSHVWSARPRGKQAGVVVAENVRLRDAELIAAAPDLLASLKEMREACAAAMRLLHTVYLDERFVSDVHQLGIADGFGVRADRAIAKAEGR